MAPGGAGRIASLPFRAAGRCTMGLNDRDYYQESRYGDRSWGLDTITPVVKYLIIANVAVFLAQIFITRQPSPADAAEIIQIQKEMAKLQQAEGDDDGD